MAPAEKKCRAERNKQEHRGGSSYDPHRAVYRSINYSLRGLYCYGPSCKRRTRERAVELDSVRSLAGAPSLIRLAEQSTKFRRHRPTDKPLSIGVARDDSSVPVHNHRVPLVWKTLLPQKSREVCRQGHHTQAVCDVTVPNYGNRSGK